MPPSSTIKPPTSRPRELVSRIGAGERSSRQQCKHRCQAQSATPQTSPTAHTDWPLQWPVAAKTHPQQHIEHPARTHRERGQPAFASAPIVEHDARGQAAWRPRPAANRSQDNSQTRRPARRSPASPSRRPSRARSETRPDGIGRSGRSRASTSASNTSLSTMPLRYSRHDAATSNVANCCGRLQIAVRDEVAHHHVGDGREHIGQPQQLQPGNHVSPTLTPKLFAREIALLRGPRHRGRRCTDTARR